MPARIARLREQGQNRKERTAKKGQNRKERTARKGHLEQGSYYRTARTGQPEWDARGGLPGQGCQHRTTGIGLLLG